MSRSQRHLPGRKHRRPIPHFWRYAADHRDRKKRWWRKTAITPAELRVLQRAEAARRAALLGVCAHPVEVEGSSWRDVLERFLSTEQDVVV